MNSLDSFALTIHQKYIFPKKVKMLLKYCKFRTIEKSVMEPLIYIHLLIRFMPRALLASLFSILIVKKKKKKVNVQSAAAVFENVIYEQKNVFKTFQVSIVCLFSMEKRNKHSLLLFLGFFSQYMTDCE